MNEIETEIEKYLKIAETQTFTLYSQKLHYLNSLQMRQVSQSVTLHWTGRAASDKHSSLLGSFVSNEENEVL